jgi:PHP family Zn ribbon phosphoesterase
MSTLIELLIEFLANLLKAVQTVWNKLTKYISREIAILVYVTITVLFIFETIFITLLVALVVLRAF